MNYSPNFDRSQFVPSDTRNRNPRVAIAITPSDTKDVTDSSGDNAASYARAIYVGGAGDIALITAGDTSNSGAGTAVTFKAVPVGTQLNVEVRRVKSTGTTATLLLGLYDF